MKDYTSNESRDTRRTTWLSDKMASGSWFLYARYRWKKNIRDITENASEIELVSETPSQNEPHDFDPEMNTTDIHNSFDYDEWEIENNVVTTNEAEEELLELIEPALFVDQCAKQYEFIENTELEDEEIAEEEFEAFESGNN